MGKLLPNQIRILWETVGKEMSGHSPGVIDLGVLIKKDIVLF